MIVAVVVLVLVVGVGDCGGMLLVVDIDGRGSIRRTEAATLVVILEMGSGGDGGVDGGGGIDGGG